MNRVKILLAHLNSRGDCLYSTVIARQIKEVDFKNCHLTWAVNTRSADVIMLNPYIDEIWEIPTELSLTTEIEWNQFVKLAEQRKEKGEFDVIFYTQIIGKGGLNFDGGIRSSTYNNYPKKITISQQPVIRLSQKEIDDVKKFAEQHHLNTYKNIILMECGPQSFASHLNLTSALQLAIKIVSLRNDTIIILSSNKKIDSIYPNIIDGSVLRFRENAELTKYCTLFVGCSSGISWLTTTNWAKPLPKIILTDYTSRACSSMIYDHEYAGISTDEIIEFQEDNLVLEKLHNCIGVTLSDGFFAAKNKYRKPAQLKNYSFIYRAAKEGFKRFEFYRGLNAFYLSNKRNGFNYRALLYLLKAYFKLPFYLLQNGINALVSRKKKRYI